MDKLELSRQLWQALIEEARRSLPNECCGLLGGGGCRATKIIPAMNVLASPVAYEIRPRELFAIFRQLRAEHLDLVGIYHSHPTGDNAPSARDRARAYYPEAAYVIVSPRGDAAQAVRGFRIQAEAASEMPVEVVG